MRLELVCLVLVIGLCQGEFCKTDEVQGRQNVYIHLICNKTVDNIPALRTGVGYSYVSLLKECPGVNTLEKFFVQLNDVTVKIRLPYCRGCEPVCSVKMSIKCPPCNHFKKSQLKEIIQLLDENFQLSDMADKLLRVRIIGGITVGTIVSSVVTVITSRLTTNKSERKIMEHTARLTDIQATGGHAIWTIIALCFWKVFRSFAGPRYVVRQFGNSLLLESTGGALSSTLPHGPFDPVPISIIETPRTSTPTPV